MNTATQISVLAGEAFQVPCEHLSFDVPSGANIKVYVSANGEQYSEVTLDGIATAGIVAIECQRNQFFKVTGFTDSLTINLA